MPKFRGRGAVGMMPAPMGGRVDGWMGGYCPGAPEPTGVEWSGVDWMHSTAWLRGCCYWRACCQVYEFDYFHAPVAAKILSEHQLHDFRREVGPGAGAIPPSLPLQSSACLTRCDGGTAAGLM